MGFEKLLKRLALTSSREWPGGPAPMLLTPPLSFAREYLGFGLFQVGPSCALFRRQAMLHSRLG